jgi:hypothetical protein
LILSHIEGKEKSLHNFQRPFKKKSLPKFVRWYQLSLNEEFKQFSADLVEKNGINVSPVEVVKFSESLKFNQKYINFLWNTKKNFYGQLASLHFSDFC